MITIVMDAANADWIKRVPQDFEKYNHNHDAHGKFSADSWMPSSTYGMTYSGSAAADPQVIALKADKAAWDNIPVTDFKLSNHMIATERSVNTRYVDRVANGEPLRTGYDPHFLQTDHGFVVIDGHTRVAMHSVLGHDSMPAKVMDLRHVAKYNHSHDEKGRFASASTAALGVYNAAVLAEPQITAEMKNLAERHGATLIGLDQRLKTQSSLERKIRIDSKLPGSSVAKAAAAVSDSVRYTMQVDESSYATSAASVLNELGIKGYGIRTKNYWVNGDPYQGINVALEAPSGAKFELQFHTAKSFQVKEFIHPFYDKYKESKSNAERVDLWNKMVGAAASIPIPPGVDAIQVPKVQTFEPVVG